MVTRITTNDESRLVSSRKPWLVDFVGVSSRQGLVWLLKTRRLTWRKALRLPYRRRPFVSATQSAPAARPVAKNKCISTLIYVPRAQSLIFAPGSPLARSRARLKRVLRALAPDSAGTWRRPWRAMSLRVSPHLHIAMKDLAAMSLPRNPAGLKSSARHRKSSGGTAFVMYGPFSRKFGERSREESFSSYWSCALYVK